MEVTEIDKHSSIFRSAINLAKMSLQANIVLPERGREKRVQQPLTRLAECLNKNLQQSAISNGPGAIFTTLNLIFFVTNEWAQ